MGSLKEVYLRSAKPQDIFFNIYLARPLAVPFVLLFTRLGTTPTQVTFLSLIPALIGAYFFISWPGQIGFWAGIAAFEMAYILDCADGQLARYTGQESAVGARLDFAMDGMKALFMTGALGLRIQSESDWTAQSAYLGMGVVTVLGLALLCTYALRGTTLEKSGSRDERAVKAQLLVSIAKWVAHYPSSLPVFAVFLPPASFLWAYGAVHMLYAGRSVLELAVVHGRVAPEEHPSGEDEAR